jgi:secondary thiamine-phosphate synthase enzyme
MRVSVQFFAKLAPPEHPYLHNAIHERPNPGEDTDRVIANGWDITDPKVLEAWRAQEPFNAHSHLLSMMLGNSETIPVADGNLVIGQWQNVLFLDLDGDRERTVGIQIVGVQ